MGVSGCSLVLDFDKPIDVKIADSGALPDADRADSSVPNLCGNGVLDALEACDDNNDIALDGCSAQCNVEDGYDCDGQAPTECTLLPLCPAQSIATSMLRASCKAYFDAGYRASGRYTIDVDGVAGRAAFDVLCDMVTGGGGWTIIVNNNADAVEPNGCLPRIASVDEFACGVPNCDEDFVVPAYDLPFTELAWIAHNGALAYGPHNLYRWAEPQTFPNLTNWTLSPDESSLVLPGLEGQPIIEAQSTIAAAGLLRIANENVRTQTGGFQVTDVVTLFDQDNDPATPGNMSFTDTASIGLDDFQDGGGCSDLWSPLESRGAATLIMIR